MKNSLWTKPIIFIVFVIGFVAFSNTAFTVERLVTPPVDEKAQSLQAFETILKVLKSPRCMNCHPSDDKPRQGDEQRLHGFGVTRGVANHGGIVQTCATCHNEENNLYTNVPGAPHWALAPNSMGWMGLSDAQIGQNLINMELNGGRTPEELVHHMSHDSLVLWGWNPGEGRTPVPVPLEEFKTALNVWLENGAHVPTK